MSLLRYFYLQKLVRLHSHVTIRTLTWMHSRPKTFKCPSSKPNTKSSPNTSRSDIQKMKSAYLQVLKYYRCLEQHRQGASPCHPKSLESKVIPAQDGLAGTARLICICSHFICSFHHACVYKLIATKNYFSVAMEFSSQLLSIFTFLRWQKYISYTHHNLEIGSQGSGPRPEAINSRNGKVSSWSCTSPLTLPETICSTVKKASSEFLPCAQRLHQPVPRNSNGTDIIWLSLLIDFFGSTDQQIPVAVGSYWSRAIISSNKYHCVCLRGLWFTWGQKYTHP